MVTIVALAFTGIGMAATGWTSPDSVRASLHHLTDSAVFPSYGLAGIQVAIFSCIGIELLGTITAKIRVPDKSLPKAINAILLPIIDDSDYRRDLLTGDFAGCQPFCYSV